MGIATTSPSSAAIAATTRCPSQVSSETSGHTIKAVNIRTSGIRCRSVHKTIHAFHEQLIGSSGATVANGFGCAYVAARRIECRPVSQDLKTKRFTWRFIDTDAVKTINARISGKPVQIQALRLSTETPGLVEHALRLRVRSGSRYYTIATEQMTLGTAQPGARDFCGLRIVSRSRVQMRIRHCATPSASIGEVSSAFSITASSITAVE